MIGIRAAETQDIATIAEIYNGVIDRVVNYSSHQDTFEKRAQWFADLSRRGLPVLVAYNEGSAKVLGYGALTPFHHLDGYRYTVTGQLYIAKSWQRQGIGKHLADNLIRCAREIGLKSIIAGVNSENRASLGLHAQLGFIRVGYFKNIGFKNGAWFDDVCLQLILN